MRINITGCDIREVREPLKNPFGFKGKYLTELWQTVSLIKSDNYTAVCPCTISVLWSDERVFALGTPDETSGFMCAVTKRALEMIKGESFERPDILINSLIPELKKYANSLCGIEVAETFVLNSLVGIDYALWTLYAKENGIKTFDGIIPDYAKKALSYRYDRLARIPLISYAVDKSELVRLLCDGTGLLKIKIGKKCGDSLTKEEDMRSMLEWDKKRLLEIHEITKAFETGLSKDGNVRYYLDANGRYDNKDRLLSLLDYADGIGALGRIELLEEPFSPEDDSDVSDLPCVINADESAHSLSDVKRRIQQGYRAFALKPIAKTMSVSFEMAKAIDDADLQALCADLTVVPLLAEWNKQFASRIGTLRGMNCGVLEINGDMNYTNWDALGKLLPEGIVFEKELCGVMELPENYYETGAGLFEKNGYYSYFKEK